MANTPKILWIDRNLIRHHDYIALCLSNKAFRREARQCEREGKIPGRTAEGDRICVQPVQCQLEP